MYSMKSSFMRRTVSISTYSSLDSSIVFPSVMTVLAQERHRSQKLSALRAPICPFEACAVLGRKPNFGFLDMSL